MEENTPTSVYQYFDRYGVLIYVGVTSRRDSRQREHSRSKQWWTYVDHQTVEHYPSRGEALARETALIIERKPPFNTQQNADAAAHRDYYVDFRERARAVEDDPVSYWRSQGKRLPLAIVDVSETLTLTTLPEAAALASLVVVEGQPKLTQGSLRCGHLARLSQRGPLAYLEFRWRTGVAPSATPYAKVKLDVRKSGPSFRVDTVHI